MIRFLMMMVVAALVLGSQTTQAQKQAQKVEEERMIRDIEVAENVLNTLIKQQLGNQRTFFTLEIAGSYQQNYGVTFSLPADFTTPIVFSLAEGNNNVVVWENESLRAAPFGYEIEQEGQSDGATNVTNTYQLKEKTKERKRLDLDSIRDLYNLKVVDAAKTFIIDYGDMITQLGPKEKIVITNQGNQPRTWVNQYFSAPKRTHLSVEALKGDVTLYKQGKISRDEALSKIKVISTESADTIEPDLELLSSIFNRLYRPDLASTFYIQDNVYYEHLKDVGAIFYMQVFSSSVLNNGSLVMPTLGLQDVSMEVRNKKVIELYPKFEQELKTNILEYGRTLKCLKDDEVLVFQIRLTRCVECGIPSSLECSVKGSVLKDFNAGKIEKNTALSRISVKKGLPQ